MAKTWLEILLKEAKNYKNPPVNNHIKYVWVLSGHSTYDLSSHAFPNLYPTPPDNLIYRFEDKERIDKAVELLRKIGNRSTQLIYNGTKTQNQVLRKELAEGSVGISSQKVIICAISQDLNPQKANTFAQFTKFPAEILSEIIANGQCLAVITHRYQLPRVKRYPLAPNVLKIQPLWTKVNLLFFVADEEFDPDSPDFREALEDEAGNMQEYLEKGDLNPTPEENS